jgi:hypothetical protein
MRLKTTYRSQSHLFKLIPHLSGQEHFSPSLSLLCDVPCRSPNADYIRASHVHYQNSYAPTFLALHNSKRVEHAPPDTWQMQGSLLIVGYRCDALPNLARYMRRSDFYQVVDVVGPLYDCTSHHHRQIQNTSIMVSTHGVFYVSTLF